MWMQRFYYRFKLYILFIWSIFCFQELFQLCEKFLESNVTDDVCYSDSSQWEIVSLVFSVDRLERFRKEYKTTLISQDFKIWREFYNLLPTEVFSDIMEQKDAGNFDGMLSYTKNVKFCSECKRKFCWYCCRNCEDVVCCSLCFKNWYITSKFSLCSFLVSTTKLRWIGK